MFPYNLVLVDLPGCKARVNAAGSHRLLDSVQGSKSRSKASGYTGTVQRSIAQATLSLTESLAHCGLSHHNKPTLT